MSEIIGRQIEVGLAVENTRGTSPANPEKWLKNVSASIVAKAEKVLDNNKRGRLEDSEGARVVKKWFEGKLDGVLHADPIGYLLYNLYGAVSSSNVAGSVYSHVFTLAQNIEHASLSIFCKDGSVQQKVMKNGMLKSLEISAAVDDLVRFSAAFVAKEEAANASSPSYGTEYDFIAKDITIKLADTEGALGAATAIKAKEVNISFDPGLIVDHVVGSYNPDDIYNSKMSIEGSIKVNFADTTYKDLFTADTAKYMQIKIEGTADLGSGNYPKLDLLLYKVEIMDWNREGDADALVVQDIKFKAFYRHSDAKQSQLTLQNLTVEYSTAPSI